MGPGCVKTAKGYARTAFGISLRRPAHLDRWQMNEDAMATEKLAEGIRLFARDQEKLEYQLATRH